MKQYGRYKVECFNQETLLFEHTIEGDPALHRHWKGVAHDCKDNAHLVDEYRAGRWTLDEATICSLANRLRDAFTPYGLQNDPSLHARLLCIALDKARWDVIAVGLLQGVGLE